MAEEINLQNIETAICLLEENGYDAPIEDFPTRTGADYAAIKDRFRRYGAMVEDALQIHRCASQIAAVTNLGREESIRRMAEPFHKGYFTLAVVGKMSSGKSTFINALLGDNSLLPTGHFQTTCTLTTIQHSQQKALHVLYGDDHEETYTDHIAEHLRKLVAIPDEYKTVPVNNLNRLILADMPIEAICHPDIIAQLEDLSKSKIEVEQVQKYYNEHPKSHIPKAVTIECPLLENYQGWRIVDTPGVDAIGGIEDDTKQFLCGCDEDGNHNVDAIIFVQAAKDRIEERTLNDFVGSTMDSLTAEAKQRAFFVLTHATSPEFLRNKEEVLDLARRLFVDYSGIDEDRLLAVDSLASLLNEDPLLDLESLVDGGQPKHWKDPKEWEISLDLLLQIEIILRRKDKVEFCNENIRRKLKEMANFDTLRSMLDNFVKEEKQVAFDTIISNIKQDIADNVAIKAQDIRLLESSLGKSSQEFLTELEAEKEKLDDFMQMANNKISELNIEYSKSSIDHRFQEEVLNGLTLETFKSLSSFFEMRKKADELGQTAKQLERSLSESIKNNISDFMAEKQTTLNIAMPGIDLDHIEHEAKKASTTYKTETYRGNKKSGIGGAIGRFFGGFLGTDWGYETNQRTVEHTDPAKQHNALATQMYASIAENLNTYKKNLLKELQLISDSIAQELESAIVQRKADFDSLAQKKDIVKEMEHKRTQIEQLTHASDRLKDLTSLSESA